MTNNLKITIQPTQDWELAWSLIHDPSAFDRISNDNWSSAPVAELQKLVRGMVENPANHVLVVARDEVPVGVAICYAKGGGVFEIHTIFTDRLRGADAITAGKLCTQLMLAKPEVEKLISFCPANLPEAYFFARRVGWHFVGMDAQKWIKHGVAYAVKLVEATKKDLIPCH